MYVEELWKCFEETGSIQAYLDFKEYKKENNEHTHSIVTQDIEQVSEGDLDGMK